MVERPPSEREAAEQPAFETRGVRREFSAGDAPLVALAGVDLSIRSGSFVAISGPSGSGKTTLLSILGALDRGYTGVAQVFGQDLSRLDEPALGRLRNASLGFVFQSFHLLPHVSVLDNVLAPSLFAAHPGDARAAALQALERVGLASRAGDLPGRLSGGQRQRVAIARAFVSKPRALLCDEPTGNLDRKTGGEIIDLLDELRTASGATVVVVTHDPELGKRAERVISIVDGRVEAA